jgi:hypothetical protein
MCGATVGRYGAVQSVVVKSMDLRRGVIVRPSCTSIIRGLHIRKRSRYASTETSNSSHLPTQSSTRYPDLVYEKITYLTSV